MHSVARRPLARLRHRTGRGVLRQLKRPAAPECASRTPLFSGPQPPAGGLRARPATEKARVFDFGPTFVTLPRGGPISYQCKSNFLSV